MNVYHIRSAKELEQLLKKRRKKASKKNPEDVEVSYVGVALLFVWVCLCMWVWLGTMYLSCHCRTPVCQ